MDSGPIILVAYQILIDLKRNLTHNVNLEQAIERMDKSNIYSIGHGNKKINDFISELKSFNIKYLLDIRSKPFSKWNPQFNQNLLKNHIEKENIKYLFIGDALGGIPKDKSFYNKNGKVSYKEIRNKEFFKAGLSRIIIANEKNIKIVLMCSESNPEECHRSKLIGEELLKNSGISINHIISKDMIKSQEVVINELTKGKSTKDIFGNEISFFSRKTY